MSDYSEEVLVENLSDLNIEAITCYRSVMSPDQVQPGDLPPAERRGQGLFTNWTALRRRRSKPPTVR